MTTKVLVTAPFPSDLIDKLNSVSRQVEIEQQTLPKEGWPDDKTTSCEVYYAIGAVPPPELAPNLRWVQGHWAGVNHLHDQPIWDSDIHITSASGIHAPGTGQYVMAQMLAWANHVPDWLAQQEKGEWPSDRWKKFLPKELRGRTVGILGYGSIGREVARLAKGFGMTVLATKRDARNVIDNGYTVSGSGDPKGELADRIYPGEATRSMVADCDYVVITLPLTSTTRHLVDENVLREMKPECVLINVGRGPIVQEEHLVRALKKGWIAGAGLDVFETEPLPVDSPLWSLDNVILSPHISGFTEHYDDRVTDLFAENIRRYLAGEPLLNLVNRQSGY
jgi:phosphoglycerate dehydrogenase-like enzyme